MTETTNGAHGSAAPTATEAEIAQMPFGPAANMAQTSVRQSGFYDNSRGYEGPGPLVSPGDDLFADGSHPRDDRP